MNPFLAMRSRGGGAATLALSLAWFVAAALPGLPVAAQPSSAAPAAGVDRLVAPPITPTEAAARAATAPGAADAAANASAPQAVRPPTEDDVRIDLVRNRNNRVVEVIVTPAHVPWNYAMVNRDSQPTTAQSGGLSTPRFFRFDF
jgi:hypothetical protein